MSLSRLKTWSIGEILTAADLNGEINNILQNALSLISPLTGNLDFNNFQALNMRLQNSTLGGLPAAGQAGRSAWVTDDVRGPHRDTSFLWRSDSGFANLLDFVTAGAGTEASPYTGSFQDAFTTGKVFIPPFWFSIGSTPMTINTDGAVVVGMGYNSVLVFSGIADAGGSNHTGAIHVASGTTVRGTYLGHFRLNGSTAKTGTTPTVTLQKPAGIAFGNVSPAVSVSRATIEHMWFEEMPWQAIQVAGGSAAFDGEINYIRILYNRFENSDGGGITGASGDDVDAQIIGNIFTLENFASIEWSGGGTDISHNRIHDVDGTGITVVNHTSDTRWTSITNNILHTVGDFNGSGSPGAGIAIGQSDPPTRYLVANNTLRNIAGHGIVRQGTNAGSGEIHILGNVVEGFGTSGRTPSPDLGVEFVGIAARNTPRIHAKGNVVQALGSRDEGVGIDIGGSDAVTNTLDGNVALGTYDVQAFNISTNVDVGKNSTGAAILSPAQITTNQDDYDPDPSGVTEVWRVSSDTARDITGLAGGYAGRRVTMVNVGSFNITLKNEPTTSVDTNEFRPVTGADIVLANNEMAQLLYDETTTRWRVWKL